ncbi:MAG: hypothetical protein PVG90_07775 [Bacillota bacterium]|jgi:hypothetical protein
MPDPVVEIVTPEYRNVEVDTLDQAGYYRMTSHNETNQFAEPEIRRELSAPGG